MRMYCTETTFEIEGLESVQGWRLGLHAGLANLGGYPRSQWTGTGDWSFPSSREYDVREYLANAGLALTGVQAPWPL